MGNIWLVPHPVGQFQEDVKALARQNGLRIIDVKFKSDIDPEELARDPPKLTPIKKQAGKGA